MTVNRTTLLDLPLPVTGTESGTWGDITNNGLTEYLDIAIAGSLALSTDADVLLASTEGTASADNIGGTTAQYAVLRCTGARTVTRNITASAWAISSGTLTDYSKTYIVVNETTGGQNIVLRATNSATPTYTTGVTIVPGERAVCVWNGSDFVKAGGVIGGSNTQVQYNNGGVLGGIANATSDGTTLSLTSPKVITGINDTNGNELLKVTATASAVNELTLANAATGNAPTLSATGDDTNIGINITPKGSGAVTISNLAVTTIDATNIEVTNIKAKDGTASITLADSTGVASFTANPTLSAGTANGVLYLNGSKVATSGSALTFDGTNLGVGTNTPAAVGTTLAIHNSADSVLRLTNTATGQSATNGFKLQANGTDAYLVNYSNGFMAFYTNAAEGMRLTSTGLGIGTSSPTQKLQVSGGNILVSSASETTIITNGGNFTTGAVTDSAITKASGASLLFGTGSTEQMRLDSSGNLGIGTSSPTAKLHVNGDIRIADTSSLLMGIGAEQKIFVAGGANSTYLTFNQWTGSAYTERMRLDSSGNLGLGVTPSAWNSTWLASEIQRAGNAVISNAVNSIGLTSNAYLDSVGWKYGANGAANFMAVGNSGGQFVWYTAPSGTAGNAITFTQAMTLDASGNLGVGETSPDTRAHIYGANTAGRGQLYIQSSGTVSRFVMANSSDAQALNTYGDSSTSLVTWDAGSGYSFRWTVADTERARITSGGDFFIGNGETAASPSAGILSATGGTGTDIAGANLTIRGGASTGTGAGGVIIFSTAAASGTSGTATNSASERARITSGGDLLVGTTLNGAGARLKSKVAAGTFGLEVTDEVQSDFIVAPLSGAVCRVGPSAGAMAFYSANTERARITSGGAFYVGTTTAPTATAPQQVVKSGASDWVSYVWNSNAAPYGLRVQHDTDTNGTGNQFLFCAGSPNLRAEIRSNGGLANYSANDVNLSDRREKTNFAPAKSYLDTICAIPVQTFNYIDQSENDPGLTLGVVAQDVQAVAPELVMESNWGTEDNPKMRLSIYQTDLQYALMKCIQEQQALIQSLTARVALLEGN